LTPLVLSVPSLASASGESEKKRRAREREREPERRRARTKARDRASEGASDREIAQTRERRWVGGGEGERWREKRGC